ncbi:MAG: hypothetical protein MZU91_01370 [Desulfosudis oleivorans]|nr:hypothetical protein [Desulfosudis oleivorans]
MPTARENTQNSPVRPGRDARVVVAELASHEYRRYCCLPRNAAEHPPSAGVSGRARRCGSRKADMFLVVFLLWFGADAHGMETLVIHNDASTYSSDRSSNTWKTLPAR